MISRCISAAIRGVAGLAFGLGLTAAQAQESRLEAIVKQASPGNRSCAIANQSPLALTGREVYPRVVVQVRLRCGAPELASVLHQIESGSPRLFVENLNILAQRYAFQASETGAGGLAVNFDLYGYLKPSPAAPREPARAP